ncbi:hypothetical protein LCGC14_2150720 [marine sediment metagenome]|uniref:Iron ABC transporter permease n=1 Tax=marine sediment metagenome TaxID=412755 RepID=A0A0F9EHX5_9ZZZZ
MLIAALVLLPIGSVLWLAATPTEDVWGHLLSTTLPRYLSNSLVLMIAVGALAAATGTGAAWLVVMYRFPGHRWLQWLYEAKKRYSCGGCQKADAQLCDRPSCSEEGRRLRTSGVPVAL